MRSFPARLKKALNLTFTGAVLLASTAGTAMPVILESPGEAGLRLRAWVDQESGALQYSVNRGEAVLVQPSPAGVVTTGGEDLSRGFELTGTAFRSIHERYTLPNGKKSRYNNRANEAVLHLRHGERSLKVAFRLYAEGFAYRFLFEKPVNVVSESSAFYLGTVATGYGQRARYINRRGIKDRQNNESIQQKRTYSKMTGHSWYMPLLLKLGDDRGWAWLSEAMLADVTGPAYSASRLHCEPGGRVAIGLDEDHGQGSPVEGVQRTPWRAVMLSRDLATIVESGMILNLAEPSVIADTSWIKAGRVSWPWLTDLWGNNTLEGMKTYIDLARQAGWEYAAIDLGWYEDGEDWVQKAVAYAERHGVDSLLWYDYKQVLTLEDMEREFSRIREWGVTGVKIDFVFDDHQDMQTYIVTALREAARYGLMVNFHGITKPVGYRRTWPNLMTQEAVKGSEWLRNNADNPAHHQFVPDAVHHAILPFTRNVCGPMDYTPVMLDPRARKFFTAAHDIALAVIFQSGFQHYGSTHDVIRESPAFPFLKACPAAWDETRLLEGEPAEHVLMARRNDEAWFVGGITVKKRTFRLSFDFLDEGREYQLSVYRDGAGPEDILAETHRVSAGETTTVTAARNGGFAMSLVPVGGR